MGVIDGQSVNAAVTNPAFINKNIDDVMPNKLGFSRALSGASLDDIQASVNKLYAASGASESQTGTVYGAPAGTVTDGDSYQTAIYKLSTKFATTSGAGGHQHTGAAGDAPPLSQNSIQYTDILPTSMLFVDALQFPNGSPTDVCWDYSNRFLGVRIASPESVMHIDGDLSLTVSDVALPSDTAALSIGSRTSNRLTGSGGTIRGITDGINGKLLSLFNGTSSDVIFTNEDGSATAEDRIVTPGSSDVTLPTNGLALLQYQPAISRWGMISGSGGGSGSSSLLSVVSTSSGPYNATIANNVILADGTSAGFTVNLYTAVGNTGRVITIKKTDSTFNVITIDGNGSETIDGSTTTTLNTQNEAIDMVSDGTNWQVLERRIPNVWNSYTVDITGSTTNPTKASSPDCDLGRWMRVGNHMTLHYTYQHTNNTGAAAGSGEYLFSLPSGLSFDTGQIGTSSGGEVFGAAQVQYTTVLYPAAATYRGSSTNFGITGNNLGVGFIVGSATTPLNGSTIIYALTAMFPISGWNG